MYSFNDSLRQAVVAQFECFQRQQFPLQDKRAAAVAVTICRNDQEPVVAVTRRSASLRAHARQWALPGGRIDEGETAVEGALRELHEEVGLRLPETDVLGVLDDFATRSGYVITPVVVWANVDWRELVPNPDEVEFVRPFSFLELSRDDSPVLRSIPESERQVLSMRFHDDQIFAPTGAMLYQFRELVLFDRVTRVAAYEQPVFAWQ
ncbi:MAG: CoA pyrophosphatase [Pseudomonadota bacterium]